MPAATFTSNLFSLLANLNPDVDDDVDAVEATHVTVDDGALPKPINPSTSSGGSTGTAVLEARAPALPEIDTDLDYRPDDDEFVDPPENEEDPDLEIMHTTFDVLALEEQQHHKPVFTKGMLRRIAHDVACILSEQSKAVGQRTTGSIHHEINGRSTKVWKAVDNANSITINYMTRVELCPAFQERFATIHKRSKSLQGLNTSMTEREPNAVSAPYFIESYRRAPDTTHLNPALMKLRHAKLHRTQELWTASTSCTNLLSVIRIGAGKLKTPITKIVCIGLGKLNSDPAFYQSALQHMSVISIAKCIDAFNRAEHPKSPPVQIIAQDPCYEPCDHILLQQLTTTPIDFTLSDPGTLLAIDPNTLVVSAYLPTSVPLMQIVADMFAQEQGPAMMLWDQVKCLSTEKRWYCMRNRDSPGVARFLDGYLRWQRGFGGLEEEEEELKRDLWGEKRFGYWLDGMDLWLRKDG